MEATFKYSWNLGNKNSWVLNIEPLTSEYFIASTSAGSLSLYNLRPIADKPIQSIEKAHESSINQISKINKNVIASCSSDGVKVWDFRQPKGPVQHFDGMKNLSTLSISYHNNLLAAGGELRGVDSELHIWDLREPGNVVKSFVDSHHDDITSLEFHPTDSNYLMSGSTDGYVNIYDLSQSDEDEALHQVINFTSVHSCHFTQPRRISILSHIETLSFHELNNQNYEKVEEPSPHDLGDVRNLWSDCEYVVDISASGYVSYGANSKSSLTLLLFDPICEEFNTNTPINFPGGHSEEVVRDLRLVEGDHALTCGEDGKIKLWELPHHLMQYNSLSANNRNGDHVGPKKVDTSYLGSSKKKKSKKDTRFKPY